MTISSAIRDSMSTPAIEKVLAVPTPRVACHPGLRRPDIQLVRRRSRAKRPP